MGLRISPVALFGLRFGHHLLFKKTKEPLDDDIWRQSYASDDETESQRPMVVMSKQMVALRVLQIIQYREDWLKWHDLPRSILLNEYWQNPILERRQGGIS